MTLPSPTLSVVIPANNRERYIGRAIESLLAQSEPTDEILVIDDASTDRTAAVAAAYGPPVRVITIPHTGVGPGHPRNVGIEAARGSHIMFLDSDDHVEPTIVARHREALRRMPDVGLIASNYYVAREFPGEPIGREVHSSPEGELRPRTELAPRLLLIRSADAYRLYCRTNFLRFPATIPRSICQAVLGFDDDLRTSEDLAFFFRVLARHDLIYLDEPLHTYVHHSSNISEANLLPGPRLQVIDNYRRALAREMKYPESVPHRRLLRARVRELLFDVGYQASEERKPLRALRCYAGYVIRGGRIGRALRGVVGLGLRLIQRPARASSSS